LNDERDQLRARKLDHIRLCLDEESQGSASSFDRWFLEHEALPEIALSEVDLSVEFLGKRLSAPVLVSSMTGGPELGGTINKNLGEAIEALGLGMGVGSQRVAIVDPSAASSFSVRPHAPSALLLANLGAVQLNYGFGESEARRAVEMIGADGLFLHLNPLQEAVQPEGDTDFRGLTEKIGALAKAVPFPVLVKECGAGINARAAAALFERGVKAIDVSGTGGTSWAKVEGLRSPEPIGRALGDTFKSWGVPTPIAVKEIRAAVPVAKIIASGGIRTGVDAAKAIALGADLVSIAQPVLKAALESSAAVRVVLERFIAELRVACFCVGARSISDLSRAVIRTY
jgi:isopentenyl-diphosphate Delta-isomerase